METVRGRTPVGKRISAILLASAPIEPMKIYVLILALSLLAIAAAEADPKTFDEYKRLPETERRTLHANAANPLWSKFVVWDWRLQIGEELWQQRQMNRLANDHGFTSLDNLFLYYKQYKQEYLKEEWRRRKSTTPSENPNVESTQWHEDFAYTESQYVEALRLFSVLAPTAQAQILNKKADDLLSAWMKQFPDGTDYSISMLQMTAMDQEVQQTTEALKNLPKLTPQEVQTEIDSLPIDHMR